MISQFQENACLASYYPKRISFSPTRDITPSFLLAYLLSSSTPPRRSCQPSCEKLIRHTIYHFQARVNPHLSLFPRVSLRFPPWNLQDAQSHFLGVLTSWFGRLYFIKRMRILGSHKHLHVILTWEIFDKIPLKEFFYRTHIHSAVRQEGQHFLICLKCPGHPARGALTLHVIFHPSQRYRTEK